MTPTPIPDATPRRRRGADVPILPLSADAEPGLGADPTPPIADAEGLPGLSVPGLRSCVLCGMPLRSGQHVLRMHGSTVHARCTHKGR